MSGKKGKRFGRDFKARVAFEAIHAGRQVEEREASLFEIRQSPKPLDSASDTEKLYSETG